MSDKKFDKKRCLSNIYYLAKEKNIKIGELEEEAGVSAGYLSRINKEDSETNPGIDLLIVVADLLYVSLDALVNYEFERQTPTEKFLLNFIETLTHDTTQKDRSWTKETASSLSNLKCDEEGNVDHPLFYIGAPDESECSYLRYYSHFETIPGSGNIEIIDDCFNTTIQGGAQVYLMRVIDTNTKESGHELYLIHDGKISPLCADKGQGGFSEALANLYSAAVESCKHIKINDEARAIIDAFMAGIVSDPQDSELQN